MTLDLTYSNLQKLVEPYLGEGRFESRAFLSWFLENVYRLEPTQAEDCVCDGSDDRGVDGIFVDHQDNRIDVFQAKISLNDSRELGDTVLRDLVGTLAQFESSSAVQSLVTSTRNAELRNRLEDENVASLVDQEWIVRGVFVTNSPLNDDANRYLQLLEAPTLVVYDRDTISEVYISPKHANPRRGPTTFDTTGFSVSEFDVAGSKVVVAPLSGPELVTLDGIESGELFDYNVRQSLGRTNVNRDIEKSVRDINEHSQFMLYHNGLTIIADSVTTTPNDITIENYIVVNGCQSLTVLSRNRKYVTDDLRVLGRLIELDRGSPLLDKITHNSNNQNGIKPRDFQSNNPIQLRLRNEFEQKYGGEIGYVISRGETPSATEIIDNEMAARVLLAYDLGRPWACHQTYRLFDEFHTDIFARPDLSAARIICAVDAFSAVNDELHGLNHVLMRKYTLSKYFLLYLLAEALRTDVLGSKLIDDPTAMLGDPIDPEKRSRMLKTFRQILRVIIVDVNYEVDLRAKNEDWDHKRVLKSPNEIRALHKDIMPSYEKVVRSGRVESIGSMWANAILRCD